jgi:hypothetical protein
LLEVLKILRDDPFSYAWPDCVAVLRPMREPPDGVFGTFVDAMAYRPTDALVG